MSYAWDLSSALDEFFEKHENYLMQKKAYRDADAAIGEPEWGQMKGAWDNGRTEAFRELLRRGLGMDKR